MDDEERDDEEASGLDKYKLDAATKLEEEEVSFYLNTFFRSDEDWGVLSSMLQKTPLMWIFQ